MNIVIKRLLFTIVSTGFTYFLMNLVIPRTHVGPMRWLELRTTFLIIAVMGIYLIIAVISQCIIWMYYYWVKGIILEQNTFLKIHNIFGIPIIIAIILWVFFTTPNYEKIQAELKLQERIARQRAADAAAAAAESSAAAAETDPSAATAETDPSAAAGPSIVAETEKKE